MTAGAAGIEVGCNSVGSTKGSALVGVEVEPVHRNWCKTLCFQGAVLRIGCKNVLPYFKTV